MEKDVLVRHCRVKTILDCCFGFSLADFVTDHCFTIWQMNDVLCEINGVTLSTKFKSSGKKLLSFADILIKNVILISLYPLYPVIFTICVILGKLMGCWVTGLNFEFIL